MDSSSSSYLASIPLNAQDPSPAESPPVLKLAPGIHFICFPSLGNRIWMVVSQWTPQGTNYMLISPDGDCVLIVFEPNVKA